MEIYHREKLRWWFKFDISATVQDLITTIAGQTEISSEPKRAIIYSNNIHTE